jgi:peptidoglycan/LPS O-acetylase OafA/YrhL
MMAPRPAHIPHNVERAALQKMSPTRGAGCEMRSNVLHRERGTGTGTRVNFIRLDTAAAPVQPSLRSQSRLPEIDGLRGIACLLVVLLHCLLGFVIFPALTPARNVIGMFLAGGVDAFFVLSGFLIIGILIDNRSASNYFRVFWTRRVLRIFPVHFLLYATFLIMLGVKIAINAPALNVWLFKDSLPVWSYPLFIQNYFMAVEHQTGSYWVGVTWSLAIEEQFYFIMPLLAFVLRRSQVFSLALVCIAIAFSCALRLAMTGGTTSERRSGWIR